MDLLLELFSEEIPARMQARAAEDLKRLVTDAMVGAGLTYAGGRAFATPRRLVLALSGLPKVTPGTVEERRGPRTDAPEKALDGFLRATGLTRDQLEAREEKKGAFWFATIRRPGRPAAQVVAESVTAAIRNFPWPKSMRWGSGSLRWVRPLHSILCILSDEGGTEIVPLEIGGIRSGDETQGHRFMAPGAIRVSGFEDYAAKLDAARVVLDADERARRIEGEARHLAFARGLEVVGDKGLLAEVAGLVEWPVPLMGSIGEQFLDLPPEVLRTSMREHQKFFSVRDAKTGRIGHFITVANIEAPDGGKAILEGNGRVLSARLTDARFFWENDLRVVKGRGMEGIAEMAKPLDAVTFHAKLGTQGERVARIAALAREIAPKVGADPDLTEQAARVAKADLASQMVYEFPELQGTMGRYYAAAAGLPPEVAAAAEAHYRPLGPSDEVPSEPVSIAVALADKLDMLTGFWAIDEKPTGSKDPFALRRAALGVIRLILHARSRLNLTKFFEYAFASQVAEGYLTGEYSPPFHEMAREFDFERDVRPKPFWADEPQLRLVDYDGFVSSNKEYIAEAQSGYPSAPFEDEATVYHRKLEELRARLMQLDEIWKAYHYIVGLEEQVAKLHRAVSAARRYQGWQELFGSIQTDLLSFFADRLKVYLRDQGIRHDVIQACFELGGQDDLVLLVNRVRALQDFLGSEDGENLLIAYRRAANIVSAEERKDGVEYSGAAEKKFAEQPEEHALFAALDSAEPAIAAALEVEDFAAAMTEMARLRAPIDAFFDKVTVNTDNPVVRRNRLCLLTRIRQVMRRVAIWDAIEG